MSRMLCHLVYEGQSFFNLRLPVDKMYIEFTHGAATAWGLLDTGINVCKIWSYGSS